MILFMKKVEKSGLHLATKIYNIYKNEVPIRVSDLDNDVLMEIFKTKPYFEHNKHHYIPRFILSNWQTNTTKIPKNKKANSYIFNFKNGYINNENFNIYEKMQSTQYYTKIIYENGVEVMYTLEGGFINNISEYHIIDILNNYKDKKFFSNTSISNNDFYNILSAIYYINNRGSEAFFHDIFNLIINSNNFIKEYKKLLVRKFYEFYKKSIFKNKKFSVYVMNFEENFCL